MRKRLYLIKTEITLTLPPINCKNYLLNKKAFSSISHIKISITAFLFLLSLPAFSQNYSLEHFIQQAQQNSPLLREYQNQILSSRLDSLILRAQLKTQVNFVSSNSYAPIVKGYGYDEVITNKTNISAIVQASRNFFTANNVANQLSAIRLQSQAISDTIAISQQDIKRAITDQYIVAYGDLLTMDFNKEIYDLLSKEEVALKKLTQASVYKQVDYLTFYTTLQQQEFAYMQSQIQYNTDYLTLNYLAGVVDTTIARVEPPQLNDSAQYDFYHSVFYKRFTTDSMRLETQKALIRYEYKPRLGGYTDAGYVSSLYETPYKNFGFSIGVSLVIPIYDGHQREYRLRQVNLQENTRLANKSFFVNQYNQQVAILNQQLHASDLLVKTISDQIRYVNTLITANAKLLQTGDIRVADYVLAITNYINARNLLNQNNVNRLRIVNQINYYNR